jgi:hypothetical protein
VVHCRGRRGVSRAADRGQVELGNAVFPLQVPHVNTLCKMWHSRHSMRSMGELMRELMGKTREWRQLWALVWDASARAAQPSFPSLPSPALRPPAANSAEYPGLQWYTAGRTALPAAGTSTDCRADGQGKGAEVLIGGSHAALYTAVLW